MKGWQKRKQPKKKKMLAFDILTCLQKREHSTKAKTVLPEVTLLDLWFDIKHQPWPLKANCRKALKASHKRLNFPLQYLTCETRVPLSVTEVCRSNMMLCSGGLLHSS